jgi:hypothetical protein
VKLASKKIQTALRRKHPKMPIDGPESIAARLVVAELNTLFEQVGVNPVQSDTTDKLRGVSFRYPRGAYAHALAISDLLTLWHQHPNFVDPMGKPVPIRTRAGRKSFRALAALAAPTASAAKLLSELKRLHLVSIDRKGLIHVRTRSLHVFTDKQLRALHTLSALRGFLRTLRHNLHSAPSNSDQMFHRVAWNGNFKASQIPRLKIWLRRYGQGLLESADSWMLRRSQPSNNSRRGRNSAEVSIGVYLSVFDK